MSRTAEDTAGNPVAAAQRRRLFITIAVAALAMVGVAVGAALPVRHRNYLWLGVATGVAMVIVARRQGDWRTRIRVSTAHRKGGPIEANDRDTARALISAYRGHRWVPWSGAAVGVLLLVNAAVSHGNQRWFDTTAGVLILVRLPLSLRERKRVLSRDAEMSAIGSPPDAAAPTNGGL